MTTIPAVRLKRTLCAVVVTTALASCTSSETSGRAMTGAESTASPGPSVPGRQAPPLDLTAAKSAPCEVLTPADIEGLGVQTTGVVEDGINGRACYYAPGTRAGPRITVVLNDVSGGLPGLYARRSNFGVFEPGTLGG